MLKIQILQIAPTKNAHVAALEAEFQKRIAPFAKLETITLPASKSDQAERAQNEEMEHFQRKLNPRALSVALHPEADQLTSESFAEWLEQHRDFGEGFIQFLIGGSHGLHPTLLAGVDERLSLSKMTFTHEMVRVFFKEQLYRAMTILAGKAYHK